MKMRNANGVHCQLIMRMIEPSGNSASQSTGSSPTAPKRTAKRPYTGFMNMFFQSRALTVGMMKNGEISMTRTMPRPGNRWLTRMARASPRVTVMTSTDPTSRSVFRSAGPRTPDR